MNSATRLARTVSRLLAHRRTDTPLGAPLTTTQIRARLDRDGYITGVIAVGLSDLTYANDFEDFLDLLSERLVGAPTLMALDFHAVGITDQGATILLQVSGDPSDLLADADADDPVVDAVNYQDGPCGDH